MKMLMGLYGRLESDGRVHRSLKALRDDFAITIFAHCKPGGFSMDKVEVIERHHGIYDSNKLLEQLLYNLHFIRVALQMKPDILYAHDYYLATAARIIRFLTGAKVIYDAHELIAPTPGQKHPKREKIFHKLENFSIRKFDLVLAANEERAEYMQKVYRLKERPLPILNIIEKVEEGEILSKSELTSEIPILEEVMENGILFIYQGVVTEKRRIGDLLEKVAKVENAQVVVAGAGEPAYIESIKSRFREQGLTNLHFLGKIKLRTLYSLLNYCDYGLISYANVDLNNSFCAPNKLYEYAYFGLPMITSDQILFKKTFENYPIGVVATGDDQSFGEAFNKFQSQRQQMETVFESFKTAYNFEIEKRKLLESAKRLKHAN